MSSSKNGVTKQLTKQQRFSHLWQLPESLNLPFWRRHDTTSAWSIISEEICKRCTAEDLDGWRLTVMEGMRCLRFQVWHRSVCWLNKHHALLLKNGKTYFMRLAGAHVFFSKKQKTIEINSSWATMVDYNLSQVYQVEPFGCLKNEIPQERLSKG